MRLAPQAHSAKLVWCCLLKGSLRVRYEVPRGRWSNSLFLGEPFPDLSGLGRSSDAEGLDLRSPLSS